MVKTKRCQLHPPSAARRGSVVVRSFPRRPPYGLVSLAADAGSSRLPAHFPDLRNQYPQQPPFPPQGQPPYPQQPPQGMPPQMMGFDHTLVTTAFELPGVKVARNFGLVRGSNFGVKPASRLVVGGTDLGERRSANSGPTRNRHCGALAVPRDHAMSKQLISTHSVATR